MYNYKKINKKLKSFLLRRPVNVSFINNKEKIIILDEVSKKQNSFTINYFEDPKTFIRRINDWMKEEIYPFMIERKEVEEKISNIELKKRILSGENINILLEKRKKTHQIKYRIEKVTMKTNILFVRNLETGVLSRYEMLIPVSFFIRKLQYFWHEVYAFEIFLKKSKFLNVVESNYKKRDDNE